VTSPVPAPETEVPLPLIGTHARAETGDLLQRTLTELIALSLIGKQLHWNITGQEFRSLHLHLDELVDEWRELADLIAERAVAVGFAPDGQALAVVEQSAVEPVDSGPTPVPVAIRLLVGRVAAADECLRERMERLGEIDLTSQDVLIDVTRALEKQLWTLRSQL
jgi:starvation-inducible DNA-binding protein